MANATMDHMLSLVIFIAALLVFIGLFGNTIQTGIAYQQHTALSTKTSDLLDTMLLNPGLPVTWSMRDDAPVGFGLQDPEFSQYKLSSYSPIRLASNTQSVYYSATGSYYGNLTAGFGSCLLVPEAKTLSYSDASKLLGINGTYGFQLKLNPTVTVDIEKISTGSPLRFEVSASGTGFVMAQANITYSLILVNSVGDYPSYSIISNSTQADSAGYATISFSGVNGETRGYALIVYSYLYGLKGMGYYVHTPAGSIDSVVPLVDSFVNRTIRLAHSSSVGNIQNPIYPPLRYNSTFAILTEEYTLRQVVLDQPSAKGELDASHQYSAVAVPDNAGILIVAYKDASTGDCGVVLAPWGLGAISYPVTFGGDPTGQTWVTTDIRQVTIGGLAYQAQLALWNLQGAVV
ncbi:MAG: hypothetical protein NWE93_03455 [Candidatus Bathyarchaeota archaeon]|nr:hypothetical protein [Candidatus Bathyarchaeota archaeon]